MNKEVQRIFADIYNDFTRHQAKVAAILSGYRGDMETAKARCAKYKDEAGELGKERTSLSAAARQKIADADKALHDAVNLVHIPKLKEALSAYVCEKPNSGYMEALRTVRDFNLKLSRPEIDALILEAQGGYIALRALASVAEQSGYKMTAPSIEDFQADIKRMESASRLPVMYAPKEYYHEAAEVYPDKVYFRSDGTSYTLRERPDTVYFITRGAEVSGTVKDILSTGERWSTAFVPAVSDLEPIEAQDGETITPEQQRAEATKASAEQISVETDLTAQAQQMGAARAKSDADAKAVLAHYV